MIEILVIIWVLEIGIWCLLYPFKLTHNPLKIKHQINPYPITPTLTSVASRTDPPSLPRGEGVMKTKAVKERTTKDQEHKPISAKPRFQQGAGADRE